jgi:acyl-CoA oxidase
MPDFTEKLQPASPTGPDTLSFERNRSDVPIDELSQHLLSRNDFLQRQARILPILQEDPLFNKLKQANLSRPDRYKLGLARAKKLRRYADQYKWDRLDQEMSTYLCDDVSPYMVHATMFETTVREQGDEAQRKEWLPKIEKWEAIGCYAQTELGHGSNVRAIETQARWDPRTKTFTLHSPTLTASKWWNGSMGRTANHAIVVAQLYVPKQDRPDEFVSHGPHPFIVQIRDLKTHVPLEGIVVGDIGPKYGYASMDNGYMLFDHLEIPHSAMLSNYSRVDYNTGTYTKPSNPAVVYGSLTAVRAAIIMHARLIIARAVTIAVRYSCVRKQFQDRDSRDTSSPELSVLDYSTVQIRILPLLATAFAFHYSGEAMYNLYTSTRANISQKRDFSKLTILHAQSSGLKSYCTEIAADSIETCRRAMGGHGFGGASGFTQLNNDYLSKPTVEGDNWMITQQTARYLIKRMASAVENADKPPSQDQDEMEASCRSWLLNEHRSPTPPEPFPIFDTNDEALVQAFRRRSRHLTYQAYLDRHVQKRPWNSMLLLLREISHAESQSLLISNFHQALSRPQQQSITTTTKSLSPLLHTHLHSQFLLFAYTTLSHQPRSFSQSHSISDSDLDLLPEKILSLMQNIRPHAVRLVDSWRIPDFLLDSALGRYDGRVYEDLFDRAHQRNPLNDEVFEPDYRSEEIVKGDAGEGMRRLLAKL